MTSINFWQKWLFFFGIYLSIFGIVLAFFSNTDFMNFIFNHQIDPVFWGDVNLSDTAVDFRSWIYGVLGAVISGWGVIIAYIAHYPFKDKKKWAWNCILFSALVWFIPDTIISIQYEVGFNILFNILLLLFMLLPLFFTYNQFHKTQAIKTTGT
jgi:hypothetical protein